MARPLTGVVVGAGDRGYDAYTKLFVEDPAAGRIVAVAEPDAARTAHVAERYGLDTRQCHRSWEDLFAQPQQADFALIATGDRHHVEPTSPWRPGTTCCWRSRWRSTRRTACGSWMPPPPPTGSSRSATSTATPTCSRRSTG
jgi:hypothetical protein